MILSAPEDHDVVQNIREQLQDMNTSITIDIFDDIHHGMPEYKSLCLACEQYNIFLIYVTQNFKENMLRLNQAENLVYNNLKTNEQVIQVIPVFENKSYVSCIPPSKGIIIEYQKSRFLNLIEKVVVAKRRAGKEKLVNVFFLKKKKKNLF